MSWIVAGRREGVGERRCRPASAAASTSGLNDEPVWRPRPIARLNLAVGAGTEEVAPADHRPHVAGGGVDGDERGLGVVGRIGQHLGDGGLGRGLQPEVDRGVDA